MYYVYWIKDKDHRDVISEGYVGYSKDPYKRFESHKKANSLVGNKIRTHDTELQVIMEFENEQSALMYEKQLRPKKRIGWNIAIGGQLPPDISNDLSTHEKISKTLKDKGANPYTPNTHGAESIAKALETKRIANRKMYHDPISGDYKFIALGYGEQIPNGWLPGRVKRPAMIKKKRGIDYICNTKEVIVIDPFGNKYRVTNLKSWCAEKQIPYLATCRNKYWKGWKVEG